MALFEIAGNALTPIPEESFSEAGIKERQDLQQWLRLNPAALGVSLLIISEEFGNWEDSKRRIDLLAIDEDANLVVIELKRTEDGGHMDLQSIRYAAMISAMGFEDLVQTFSDYLAKAEPNGDQNARQRILAFLGITDVGDSAIAVSNTPRIILVSADFSLEVTTTVLWLIDRGIDIRCLRVVPYKIGEKRLIDLRQVIPLAQAGEYQVRLRKKGEVARQASNHARRELTLQLLARHDIIKEGVEIEIVPEARPDGHESLSPNLFKAKIIDPSVRASVLWLHDNAVYSPTKLTNKLLEEHGLKWLRNNIFVHWRIVGHGSSMWDQAEQLAE
jgi:hypothetical protein